MCTLTDAHRAARKCVLCLSKLLTTDNSNTPVCSDGCVSLRSVERLSESAGTAGGDDHCSRHSFEQQGYA